MDKDSGAVFLSDRTLIDDTGLTELEPAQN
jgi:hypothetical protein